MSVTDNIQKIEERIARACLRSGRKREEISLVAVSKFHSREAVAAAFGAGLRCFGESRVQEAAAKFAGFGENRPGTELHLIGALQRNKAKAAALLFDCVQSLDREELARELIKHAAGRDKPLRLLLEFRTGEDSKSGFTGLDELFRTVEIILGCPLLSVRGLMTIAPNTREEHVLRSAFRHLVTVRRELEKRFPADSGGHSQHSWSCLSMGMSDDFELAIEEGSTMLRIGSAIFGERV